MNGADIDRLAADLISRFGGGAAIEAAHLADKHRERGDTKGAETWARIASLIYRQAAGMPSKRDSDYME